MPKLTWTLALTAITVTSLVCASFAAVLISNHGDWPDSWPAELNALRSSARTIDVGSGIQETIYEIRFSKPKVFEVSWPFIAPLMSKGGTLTLYRADGSLPEKYPTIFRNDCPAVRIFCPVIGGTNELKTGPPWPDSILSSDGQLPENVTGQESGGKLIWVPARVGQYGPRFYYRARVDMELVVDGSVVDLSRIQIPEDTIIEDKQ